MSLFEKDSHHLTKAIKTLVKIPVVNLSGVVCYDVSFFLPLVQVFLLVVLSLFPFLSPKVVRSHRESPVAPYFTYAPVVPKIA
jgi:hypothetical protein